jgi:hypothetical protein
VTSSILLFLQTNNKVDVRIGDASNVPLSGVLQLILNTTVSNLYVTTGSQATTLRTALYGGSNASITASRPIP